MPATETDAWVGRLQDRVVPKTSEAGLADQVDVRRGEVFMDEQVRATTDLEVLEDHLTLARRGEDGVVAVGLEADDPQRGPGNLGGLHDPLARLTVRRERAEVQDAPREGVADGAVGDSHRDVRRSGVGGERRDGTRDASGQVEGDADQAANAGGGLRGELESTHAVHHGLVDGLLAAQVGMRLLANGHRETSVDGGWFRGTTHPRGPSRPCGRRDRGCARRSCRR